MSTSNLLSNSAYCKELASKISQKDANYSISNRLTVAEITAELCGLSKLDKEAIGLFNKNELRLTITTKPIILLGVDLGPFKIQIFDEIDNPASLDIYLNPKLYLNLTAIKPNHYSVGSGHVHPHVYNHGYCLGRAKEIFLKSLRYRIYCDAVISIINMMTTESNDAKVLMPNWAGNNKCENCGNMTATKKDYCDTCNGWYCEKCATRTCSKCSNVSHIGCGVVGAHRFTCNNCL